MNTFIISLKRLLVALVLLSCCLPLGGQGGDATSPRLEATQRTVVVSGFEPFGGRLENASWVLAAAIAAQNSNIRSVQVPVVWGEPLKAIEAVKPAPDMWLAFGEGTREFQIEVSADCLRGQQPDNKRALPSAPCVIEGGAARLENDVDARALAAALSAHGFPTKVSKDAGNYLCEEMLYSLLYARKSAARDSQMVLFIHVPVLGSRLPELNGSASGRTIDKELLAEFGRLLLIEADKLVKTKVLQQ